MYIFISKKTGYCVGIANNVQEALQTAKRIMRVDKRRGAIDDYRVVQRLQGQKGGVEYPFLEILAHGAH